MLGQSVTDEQITVGSQVYAQNCASCHGANLEGQPDWRRRLENGRMPAPPHDESGHTWHHSDQDLFDITKLGVGGVVAGYESDMPAFEGLLSDQESLVKRLDMIPLECVVRNVAAGSICRRLGVKEGLELSPPTFELFLKNDALHDPMVNEYHARSFGWASDEQLETMKALTFRVNAVLKELFAEAGMILVDYKLEFGLFDGQVVLGDEFSPDGCRIWDAETREKLDKDRFRQDLGNVIESYELVGRRLGIAFD